MGSIGSAAAQVWQPPSHPQSPAPARHKGLRGDRVRPFKGNSNRRNDLQPPLRERNAARNKAFLPMVLQLHLLARSPLQPHATTTLLLQRSGRDLWSNSPSSEILGPEALSPNGSVPSVSPLRPRRWPPQYPRTQQPRPSPPTPPVAPSLSDGDVDPPSFPHRLLNAPASPRALRGTRKLQGRLRRHVGVPGGPGCFQGARPWGAAVTRSVGCIGVEREGGGRRGINVGRTS